MKDTILEILTDLRPDVDFESETALITNGIWNPLISYR